MAETVLLLMKGLGKSRFLILVTKQEIHVLFVSTASFIRLESQG
jgi:hypothetical protein